MPYPLNIKKQAYQLRRKGHSLKEISQKLNIAKSTASAWLAPIPLPPSAHKRLKERRILGQYKTIILRQRNKEIQKVALENVSYRSLKKITFLPQITKLCCTFIWWCEGNKDTRFVRFTSSDISLVQNFLHLFRESYTLDESKFRCLVHLHGYHDDLTQKKFWSKVTNIPLSQFSRSYQKPNTGIRVHKNYPGCIAISYYDAKIAKELEAIYNAFTHLRGVG